MFVKSGDIPKQGKGSRTPVLRMPPSADHLPGLHEASKLGGAARRGLVALVQQVATDAGAMYASGDGVATPTISEGGKFPPKRGG